MDVDRSAGGIGNPHPWKSETESSGSDLGCGADTSAFQKMGVNFLKKGSADGIEAALFGSPVAARIRGPWECWNASESPIHCALCYF